MDLRCFILLSCLFFFVECSHATTELGKVQAAMILVKSGDKVSNGVIVSSTGHAVTAGHSIVRNKKVSVLVDGGWIPADTIFHSKRQDLALIKIREGRVWPAVQLGPQAMIGQPIEILTWRFDEYSDLIRKSDIHRSKAIVQMNSMNIYPTSEELEAGQVFANVMVIGAHSRHGDSGGGVYNEQGQLVGLITTTNKATQRGMTLVQSLAGIKKLLDLENVGYYTSDADKLEWFLTGLSRAARGANIAEPKIHHLAQRVRMKSESDELQNVMEFAFAQFYRVIKLGQQEHLSQR